MTARAEPPSSHRSNGSAAGAVLPVRVWSVRPGYDGKRCAGWAAVLVVIVVAASLAIAPPGAGSTGPRGGDLASVVGRHSGVLGGPAESEPVATPYSPTALPSAIGRLENGDGGVCTATVVESRSGSVAITAGHCVFTPSWMYFRTTPVSSRGWVSGLTFTPGLVGFEAPHGEWRVDRVEVDPRWIEHGHRGADVAFVHLAPRGGRTVQQVVGAHMLVPTPRLVTDGAVAIGYPALGRFSGDRRYKCSSPWTDMTGGRDSAGGFYRMRCDMTPGASGGPWLSKVDHTGTGIGVVVAVNTAWANERIIVPERAIEGVRIQDATMDMLARIDH